MQNNQRLFLWAGLAIICYLIYSAWVTENAPPPVVTPTENAVSVNGQTPSTDTSIPSATTTSSDGVPTLQTAPITPERVVTIKTDVLELQLKTEGGDIFSVKLPTYPESVEHQETPFTLMTVSEDRYYVSQTGLIGTTNVTHADTLFNASANHFELLPGMDTLEVPLTYTDPTSGLTLVKTYAFARGSFNIAFTQALTNHSAESWSGREYQQIIQKEYKIKRSGVGASSYAGPVISMPGADIEYKKIPFGNLKQGSEPIRYEGTGGWVSMIQQYFVTAWIPNTANNHVIEAAQLSNGNTMVRILGKNNTVIEPGQTHVFDSNFYAGPKIKEAMVATADNLALTLDYGWFSPISNVMLWLLKFFHGFLGNWGWSIVFLTLTVKLALFYFSDKAYRSMARMRLVGPQLELLKEQYGDDRQKLSQEMMALYRREKINPMGGCWPMLIQIPIFIALFWMLQESVELRQAPWMLWIKDLSLMDPYFVMPLIMGVTMFVQQLFNPTPPDPMQAKIMRWMPVAFTFMFMWFASGIVLYWIVNNSLTILQQWIINKRMDKLAKTK